MFKKHQLHYRTIETEPLALLLALQHFEVYLGFSSVPAVMFSDHSPLVFLNQMQNSNQRLICWLLLVQDFNIEIHNKKMGWTMSWLMLCHMLTESNIY